MDEENCIEVCANGEYYIDTECMPTDSPDTTPKDWEVNFVFDADDSVEIEDKFSNLKVWKGFS